MSGYLFKKIFLIVFIKILLCKRINKASYPIRFSRIVASRRTMSQNILGRSL